MGKKKVVKVSISWLEALADSIDWACKGTQDKEWRSWFEATFASTPEKSLSRIAETLRKKAKE